MIELLRTRADSTRRVRAGHDARPPTPHDAPEAAAVLGRPKPPVSPPPAERAIRPRVLRSWIGCGVVCASLLCAGCASMKTELAAPDATPAPPSAIRTDLHLHVSMERAARPVFWGHSGDG